ncbi:MAG: phosphate starvation-inducible protein PsiE [Patescibacteria group bacterium]|nr:MAG: phosphate starvation-inducible protein PsiE [Patescibacteria group bacterium]
MKDLDNTEKFLDFDKNKVYDSICSFAGQVKQAYEEIKNIKVPKSYLNAKNIVIAGMGGSALGGRVVDSLIPQRVRVPVEVFTEFYIPNYVNKDSLVIISSYSGSTQETLRDINEAIKRQAKIFVITTGGELEEIATKENIPSYIFNPINNPSGQPRLALGYSVTAIMAFLSKCDYIHLSDEEISEVVSFIENLIKDYSREKADHENLAKKLAVELTGFLPVIVSSEHLIGSCYAFKNQLNETAKTFAVLFDIPELNHHLLEGLKNPTRLRNILKFLVVESNLFSREVSRRYSVTKDVISKNGYPVLTYETLGKNKILQVFEVIVLSYFVAYYLAFIYGEDPSKIPWVDYFKEKLRE